MASGMNAPLYTTEILRLAASLPEPIQLLRVDGVAERRSPTCGSVVSTRVQVSPEGRIERLSQQVQACAFGQASAALVAAGAGGRSKEQVKTALASLDSWLAGESDHPGDWPGLAVLSPARSRRSRHPAILLPFRVLIAAIGEAE